LQCILAFAGQIMALTSIALKTGATVNCGAALARNDALTLDTISICVLGWAPVRRPGQFFNLNQSTSQGRSPEIGRFMR
jgi:hypothetical protein